MALSAAAAAELGRSANGDGVEEVDRIAGAKRLVAVFGYWPSFHDAEVLWLRLDRRAHGEGGYGPTLDALVHAFEMTSDVGADGYYVSRNHVLVSFRFCGLDRLSLEDFNRQNCLLELSISDVRERALEIPRHRVLFVPSSGLTAEFLCRDVIVECVRAWEESAP